MEKRDLSKIRWNNRIASIGDDIATPENGMQTFGQHLARLYQEGVISGAQALDVAINSEALALEIRMPLAIVADRADH